MHKTEITAAAPAIWLENARVVKIADDFKFTEGPVWHPGGYFLFSDTPANRIYQLFTDKNIQLYLNNSGFNHQQLGQLSHQIGSNGLVLDGRGDLYICQHGNHAIAVLTKTKELHTLVATYDGRPFNSPNDITCRSDGILYFTDPPYGLVNEVLQPAIFQPHAGVYKYDFTSVTLMGTEFQYPNGLVFSPDEEWLYVGSNHPEERRIIKYHVEANGDLRYGGLLLEENADGMTIDAQGNIYLAVKEGILMVSSQGAPLALLRLADTPTNLAWGGTSGRLLMVTAGSAVYFIGSDE